MLNSASAATSSISSIESEADLLLHQNRHHQSNSILLAVVPQYHNSSYLHFMIGRNYLYQNLLAEAETWLTAAISHKQIFTWSYYELARLNVSHGKLNDATRYACLFLEGVRRLDAGNTLNGEHWSFLIALAHRHFELDRPSSMGLYRLLGACSVEDYLTRLRYAEDLNDRNRGAEAEIVLLALQSRQSLDIWGLFALGKARALQGDRSGALIAILQTLETDFTNSFIVVTAVHRLIEAKCYAEAAEIINRYESSQAEGIVSNEVIGAHFRLYALQRDYARLTDLFHRYPKLLNQVETWLLVEAVFEVTLPGDQITDKDIDFTSRLVDVLEQDFTGTDLGPALALYHFYARRRMWERADALTARIDATPLSHNSEITLRQFEFLCLRHKLDDAKVFFETRLNDRELGQWELTSVMRFLAETKEWERAAEYLAEFVSRGFLFPKGEFFILQICRKRSCHRVIIRHVLRAHARDISHADQLLKALVDDLCVWEGKSTVEEVIDGTVHTLSCSAANEILLDREFKLSEAAESDTVYFTCSDKAYFFSVLTLLVSFSINSPSSKWIVFLDGSIEQAWIEAASDLAKMVRVHVDFVMEAQFVPTALRMQESYGIFTGGNTLSRAAFYRIYAARFLANKQMYTRAIYLDSDIVLRASPSDFEALPFQESSVMARFEEFSPEIRDASIKNQIDPLMYFNSGVIQFNMSDQKIVGLLENAIHLSENEADRLVFHDQCALNIAFKDRVQPIEDRYNYFLRPARPDNGDWSQAVLVHFLDKPKPWDVTYSREYREMWLPYAHIVRMSVPTETYRHIVSAANGR